MANLTSVNFLAGVVSTTTTGTVSTLDNLLGTAGSASANVLSIQTTTGGNVALEGSGNLASRATKLSSNVSVPTSTGGIVANAANQTTMVASLADDRHQYGERHPGRHFVSWQRRHGYPAGSTPITISVTGSSTATTATLATTGQEYYLCGFSIRATATAASVGNATVTGTVTGTLNFTQWTAPAASGVGVVEEVFWPPVIASATNTNIAVVSAPAGAGGTVSVTAWGYML